MGRLFGTDGARGVAITELTCELAMQIGRAAALVLTKEAKHKAKIVIGKDTRISSDILEAALCAGICSVGADAVQLGVIPTPGVAYLVRSMGADAGVMISASHNSVEFNGIKLFASTGYKLPDAVEEEIEALIAEHQKAPHLRLLQKRLAKEVTVMVHSEDDYNAAVDASNILFGNATSEALRKLDEDTLLAVFEGVPQFEISRDALAEGVKAVDLFVDNAAVFASKGEMRKLVQGGGVSLNKEKLNAFDQVITTADLLDEKYLLVQRGKKNYYLVIAK